VFSAIYEDYRNPIAVLVLQVSGGVDVDNFPGESDFIREDRYGGVCVIA
jgi:hypothetical protein